MQDITGEPEQPAAPFGFDHLVDREAELVQILDQVGPLAGVGDSGGLQRLEVQGIGHLAKSASVVKRDLGWVAVSDAGSTDHWKTVTASLGASFAEFGGWLMPVSYAGTVSEHNATRNTVGLFDVSHLGKALVRGPGPRSSSTPRSPTT